MISFASATLLIDAQNKDGSGEGATVSVLLEVREDGGETTQRPAGGWPEGPPTTVKAAVICHSGPMVLPQVLHLMLPSAPEGQRPGNDKVGSDQREEDEGGGGAGGGVKT